MHCPHGFYQRTKSMLGHSPLCSSTHPNPIRWSRESRAFARQCLILPSARSDGLFVHLANWKWHCSFTVESSGQRMSFSDWLPSCPRPWFLLNISASCHALFPVIFSSFAQQPCIPPTCTVSSHNNFHPFQVHQWLALPSPPMLAADWPFFQHSRNWFAFQGLFPRLSCYTINFLWTAPRVIMFVQLLDAYLSHSS